MNAQNVMKHFQKVGTWVNWERTCDQFLHGDPGTELKGIATAWIPTNKAIQEASDKGCNLFITHEPAFYPGYDQTSTGERLIAEKKELLDKLGMVLMRCHDTWDRMPACGIPDAWASFLGFKTESRPVDSFFKICLIPSLTVAETAQAILEKVRPLGQNAVQVLGDMSKRVERMAVGTGAITHLPSMYDLGADALLATDDGFNSWTGGHWSLDLDVPLIVVNHATAELPGMQAMAGYLKEQFPDVPAQYVDVEFPFNYIGNKVE